MLAWGDKNNLKSEIESLYGVCDIPIFVFKKHFRYYNELPSVFKLNPQCKNLGIDTFLGLDKTVSTAKG